MRPLAIAAAALALAACGHDQKALQGLVVQREIDPIPVPCSADPGPEPAFADTDEAIAAAPNVLERAKLYAAGRQQRLAWEGKLWAALAGCKAAPASLPAK